MAQAMFVGARGAYNGASPWRISINAPAGTGEGDTIIAYICSRQSLLSVPSGFNLLMAYEHPTSTVFWSYLYSHTFSSSDVQPYVFQQKTYVYGCGALSTFRGISAYNGAIDGYDNITKSTSSTATKSPPVPGITATESGNMICSMLCYLYSSTFKVAYPDDQANLIWNNGDDTITLAVGPAGSCSITMIWAYATAADTFSTITYQMNGTYNAIYHGATIELADYDNVFPPVPPQSGSSTKLTGDALLKQQALRARYLEYSRSQRSDLYLPVDRLYNKQRGYINPILPKGRNG